MEAHLNSHLVPVVYHLPIRLNAPQRVQRVSRRLVYVCCFSKWLSELKDSHSFRICADFFVKLFSLFLKGKYQGQQNFLGLFET